jgi:peptidoglycan/LPS O-acetylase OafA/YrhL
MTTSITPKLAGPSYIPSLDGLRAVSILIVFLSHAGVSHLIPGGFGVTVFFFLSGYLITTLLTREQDGHGRIAVGAFYLRRALRLGPPMLVTMAAALLLAATGIAAGQMDVSTIISQIFFYYNYHALYTEAGNSVEGLGILWSLAVEEHFYLIWPAIFVALARCWIGIRTITALLIVILAWRAVRFFVFGDEEWLIYISTDTRLDSLLYGCLLALLIWRGKVDRLFPAAAPIRLALLALAGAALVATFIIRDDAFRSTLRYSVQGLALMPIFHYAVTRPDDLMFRPLNWAPMRRLGLWSYTIYLAHFVIIEATTRHGIGHHGDLVPILLAAALSVGYAAAVYHWLEKPLRPLRQRLTGH